MTTLRRPDTIVHVRPGHTEVIPGGEAQSYPPQTDRHRMPRTIIEHIGPGHTITRPASLSGFVSDEASGPAPGTVRRGSSGRA